MKKISHWRWIEETNSGSGPALALNAWLLLPLLLPLRPERWFHGTLVYGRWVLISSVRNFHARLSVVAEAMATTTDDQETASPEPDPHFEGFAERFEAERADIGKLCRRLLDDPTAAEDAASEVFLRARRSLSSYDEEQSFRVWLRAIASNYCIDQLRRRKTERRLFTAADLSEAGLADPSLDVLGCLTRNQERRDVLVAIDALPAKYRLPLVLRYYRDLDYEAIADALDVSRNQVGSLLFRAKKQLRESLESQKSDAASTSTNRRLEPDVSRGKVRRRRRTRSASNTSDLNRSDSK